VALSFTLPSALTRATMRLMMASPIDAGEFAAGTEFD
jgi:hypothetical protein